ncbi:TrkH family potassium uptake protein [Falsibacillus pallidus]|uniref:Trk system potassium uptake protein TrkH n=1 Tax=Falsibacillus pallidus TaxID=493781 RepID=A0A370GH38_9BACI|nr:TrkH family potassium uptake protein [Falsibacillus pallidus]RDI43115.1 trk system potassium uptake protein TrkH [Falsibacillus pallidus]
MLKQKVLKLSPSQLLFLIFGFFILAGAVLLKLPFSTKQSITWIDAIFTSTSAMTVTGLGTVDTPETFTRIGEIIIAVLIQLGGLGIMSFAVLIYIMLGKKIGIKQRMVIQQALNQINIGGVIKLVKYLFLFSLSIELIAMVVLAFRWVPLFGWKEGLFDSFFHAISAFNNAGFALWSDNLTQFAGDPTVNIVITTLIIIGGLGFTVLVDMFIKRRWSKLSLHSKMMIVSTIVINIVSMAFIFLFEYGNSKTLGPLPLGEKLWTSYFQAITTRTAGFNTIDIGSMDESTIFLFLILMFIGAGSASTGGGIKLTTFLVIGLAVISFIRGKDDVFIFKRTIKPNIVMKSLAITITSISIVVLAVFLLNITEKASFVKVLFEVVSAFGTVGVTMGLTGSLSFLGKIIIILVMFAGKLGPLTLAFLIAKPNKANFKYPSEEVMTG